MRLTILNTVLLLPFSRVEIILCTILVQEVPRHLFTFLQCKQLVV